MLDHVAVEAEPSLRTGRSGGLCSEAYSPPQSLLLTYRPLVADRMNLADRDGDGAGLAAALVQPVLDGQTGDLLEVADVPGHDR